MIVTQNSVFRERFEQYPVNKRLAHIMNKEDKKKYIDWLLSGYGVKQECCEIKHT